jgi:hypothetical protein
MSEGENKEGLEQPFSRIPLTPASEYVKTPAQRKADELRQQSQPKLGSVIEQAEAVVRNMPQPEEKTADQEQKSTPGPDLVFSSTKVQRPDGSFYNPQAGLPEAKPKFMPDSPTNSLLNRAANRIGKLLKK